MDSSLVFHLVTLLIEQEALLSITLQIYELFSYFVPWPEGVFMEFQKIVFYLSSPRINRYQAAVGGDETKAVDLYKTNLFVSQAFLPLISVLEVVLRNGINEVLARHFNDPNWIVHQKTGFMVHPSLGYFNRSGKFIKNDFLLSEVERVEKRLRKARTFLTSGKIIAEQNFGFWTDLFEVQHYKVLLGRPIKMFKNLPPGYGRKEVYDALNQIRLFRNRIYHNEPICFDRSGSLFKEAEALHLLLLAVFDWVEPDLKQWVQDLDTIDESMRAWN